MAGLLRGVCTHRGWPRELLPTTVRMGGEKGPRVTRDDDELMMMMMMMIPQARTTRSPSMHSAATRPTAKNRRREKKPNNLISYLSRKEGR